MTHHPGATGTVSPLATPTIRARASAAIAPLDLDEGSDGPSVSQNEISIEDEHDKEVRFLMQQTRIWRVMGSAQWIAWGIVQAKVPGMEEGIAEALAAENGSGEAEKNGNGEEKKPSANEDADEEGDFDYLAYAQDRAMFFWSDLLALNLIKAEELPAPLVEHIRSRLVEY